MYCKYHIIINLGWRGRTKINHTDSWWWGWSWAGRSCQTRFQVRYNIIMTHNNFIPTYWVYFLWDQNTHSICFTLDSCHYMSLNYSILNVNFPKIELYDNIEIIYHCFYFFVFLSLVLLVYLSIGMKSMLGMFYCDV